jgi:hypothetical protein
MTGSDEFRARRLMISSRSFPQRLRSADDVIRHDRSSSISEASRWMMDALVFSL